MAYRVPLLLALSALLWTAPLAAIPVGAPLEFDSPEQAALYQQVIRELRCTVCQNQSLTDSNSGLARDLRRNTYEMVQNGASREDILDFMVSRYGEFVLYRTPLRWYTLLLWIGPFLLLLLGAAVLFGAARNRSQLASESASELSTQERQRLESLLKEKK